VALAQLAFQAWHPYFAEMQINAKRLTKDCLNAQSTLAASGPLFPESDTISAPERARQARPPL
jgi:phage tail protein X